MCNRYVTDIHVYMYMIYFGHILTDITICGPLTFVKMRFGNLLRNQEKLDFQLSLIITRCNVRGIDVVTVNQIIKRRTSESRSIKDCCKMFSAMERQNQFGEYMYKLFV